MPDTRRSLSALQTLYADNTAGDISAQDGRDELISSHPEKTSQSDTQANEPSSGQLTGDLFFPNNGFQVERYSGSAWQPWGPLFPFTKPVDGDFAWINQGSSSVATTNGGIVLAGPDQTGTRSLRVRKKTAPATPYTVTVAFTLNSGLTSAQANPTFWAGGCWRQSSDGKLITWGILVSSGTSTNHFLALDKWDSATSFNGTYFETGAPAAFLLKPIVWLRMTDDGTNRKASISDNGQTWIEVHSVGRTNFMTADEVGFFINPETTALNLTLLHWKEA